VGLAECIKDSRAGGAVIIEGAWHDLAGVKLVLLRSQKPVGKVSNGKFLSLDSRRSPGVEIAALLEITIQSCL